MFYLCLPLLDTSGGEDVGNVSERAQAGERVAEGTVQQEHVELPEHLMAVDGPRHGHNVEQGEDKAHHGEWEQQPRLPPEDLVALLLENK